MTEGDKLRGRLAALRRQLRLVAGWRGVAYLVALALAVVLLVGLIDYLYDLYPLVRAVALVGTLAGLGLLVWKQLLVPLSKPMDDLSLALQIEERHPTLNDALASTVQFLDHPRAPDGESAPMRREMVRRTIGRVGSLDFNKIVDRQGLRTASFGAGAFLLLGLGFAWFAPELSAKAVWRLATPFSSVEWPKKTLIDLDTVVKRIGRNREYRLSGTVRGVVPQDGLFEVSFDGLSVQRRPFAIRPDDDGKERFSLSVKPEEVTRSFRFRLTVNDAVTEEIRVEVLPLPQLDSLDGKPSPQLTLTYPRYTDLPSPHRTPPGSGNVDAVAGTVVEYRAAADRPLKRAWVQYQPEIRESVVALMLSPLAAPDALGVLSTVALSRQAYEPVPATLSQDRKRLSVTFRPVIHGSYALHFEDDHELENSRQYELRIKPDPSPVVKLERPSPSRDVLSVLPDAEIPLEVVVEDPMFAVRSCWLEYRTGPDEPVRVLSLYDAARGLNAEMGPWLGAAAARHPVPRLRLPRVGVARTLALARITHPDGSPLKDKDVITIQAAADDFDDVTPKEPGRSHAVEIRIIDRSEMMRNLNQEELRLQQDLAKLLEKQREAREKVAEIEARMRKDGKMSPEREAQKAEAEAQKHQDEALAEEDKAEKSKDEKEKQKHQEKAAELRQKAQEKAKEAAELKRQAAQMAEAMDLQQQVREKVGKENEALRAEVERHRETLKNNGMENSSAMERATLVKKELERLAEKELDQIEPKLADAKKMADLQDPQARQERMAELEAKAKQAEREAKAAEEQAKRLEEQAALAEEGAAKADDAEEKGRREAEAKKSRAEALAQKEKAKEKMAQADAARDEVKTPPDPSRARQAVSEARKAQEEVEKSLNALLQDLEPSGSTREVRREAGELLQKQREAMAQLDEVEKKQEKDAALGKSPDELDADQKAALDAAAQEQKKLADKAKAMAATMKDQADKRREKDPEGAKAMKDAADQVEEGDLAGKMQAAQEAIGKNQLNEARKKQREAMAELEKLNKNLEDKREEELDRLAKKLREAEKKVEELMDEQEKLQKKVREAEKEKDEKKRDEELARLAKQQKKLQEKTEELLKDLSRLRNQRAKQALGAAGEEMGEAGKQLSRGGKQDDDKQEDVLDRLEETRRELEKARKKAEEELAREQLARVADAIKRIRERQQGHVEEAKRVQDAVQQRNDWSRGLRKSAQSLGDNQVGLGEETDGVARKELAGAPVFSRLMQRAARSMDQAGKRAREMGPKPPPPETLPDGDLGRHQQDALRRLTQLLESLKEAQGERKPLGEQGGGGDDGGGGGGGGDDSLPPMAQLKLLRNLQDEVNRRTEDFRRKNPNVEGIDAKQRAELDDIRREQKEVADLLEQMTRPPGEPDEAMKDDEAKKGDER